MSRRRPNAQRLERERRLPAPMVRRLPVYLRNLETLASLGITRVASTELASRVGVSHDIVRRDLWNLGVQGVRGAGYDVAALELEITRALGLTQEWPVAIIGLGNLGRALLSYSGFMNKGFRFAAAFDIDPALVGTIVGGLMVESMSKLRSIVRADQIAMAVLTTPREAAQGAAEVAVKAGIRSFLNFAPVLLDVPDTVTVRQVDLSVELQVLAYHHVRRQLSPGTRATAHDA